MQLASLVLSPVCHGLLLAGMLLLTPPAPGMAAPAAPTSTVAAASTETAEAAALQALTQRLWAGHPAPTASRCLAVRAQGLQDPYGHIDPVLAATLTTLMGGVKSAEAKTLAPLFHPRLRTSLEAIRKALAQQDYSLQAPYEVSIYRLFALATPDGRATALPCASDGEEVEVNPHYGYQLQFGAWLQVLGQKELGRIYVTLVPKEGRWHIGYFHFHKWSHAGKTFEHWFAEANQHWTAQEYPLAYVKADIAAKLVRGSEHFQLAALKPLDAFKEAMLSRYDWQATVKDALGAWAITAVSTVFVDDGVGVLVRRKLAKEISAREVRADCEAMQTSLQVQSWFKTLKGLRCSYTLESEDPSREGRLGSLFVPNPQA